MNVLFINMAWDAASCSFRQHAAINKYTSWKSRHFRAIKTFYDYLDVGPENYNQDEFRSIMESADVIEWCSADHNYKSPHSFGFDLWEIAKSKKNIFHDYNSFLGHWRDRAMDKAVWTRKKDLGYNAMFSSIPQAAKYVYDGGIYVPDLVDETLPEFTPDNNRNFNRVILGHFPTGDTNNKNTVELLEAIRGLDIELVMERNKTNAEILRLKRKCNLAFDCLWRGFHGATMVENMALGIPTICGTDVEFDAISSEYFGDIVPMFRVSAQNGVRSIRQAIEFYIGMGSEKRMEYADTARRFAKERWSASIIANNMVKEYEKL